MLSNRQFQIRLVWKPQALCRLHVRGPFSLNCRSVSIDTLHRPHVQKKKVLGTRGIYFSNNTSGDFPVAYMPVHTWTNAARTSGILSNFSNFIRWGCTDNFQLPTDDFSNANSEFLCHLFPKHSLISVCIVKLSFTLDIWFNFKRNFTVWM